MGKHKHVALLEVGLNIVFIHIRLKLIINKNHDNIGFFAASAAV